MKITTAIAMAGMLLCANPLWAGKFDLLLMPGPVVEGHAKFETECEQCHVTLEKESQGKQCLACHDHQDVAKDIREHTGFHGRLPAEDTENCKHCHSEHKGRAEDIVNFNSEAFDHKQADFELKGAHRGVVCKDCHTERYTKFNQAPSNCFACHEKSDAHQGKLGEECEKCHSEENWKRSAFDHDKDTKFKLTGGHKELVCRLCHAEEHYKDTPKDCYTCHFVNDRHNGQFGDKCEKCHTSQDWKKPIFDHSKDTKFSLTGRHQQAQCASCHKQNPYEVKLKQTCVSCHEKDDEHLGRNGSDCAQCHSTKDWKQTDFDHDRDTPFALRGKHTELICTACHRSAEPDALKDAGCIDCHRANDVHRGSEGEGCGDCHNPAGWREKVFFDHGLTRFPLIGLHGIAACESCHLDADFTKAERECNACHGTNEPHEGRFGERCELCHNPNGWMHWEFDHDRQTKFKLEDRHREVDCHACHLTTLDRHTKLSTDCFGCHRTEDVHEGRFGRRCDRCHNAKTFKEVVVP